MDRHSEITRQEPELPVPLRDLYLLLRELARAKGPAGTVVLEQLRSEPVPFGEAQLWTRLSMLLEQLGIAESRVVDIAKGFAAVIENGARIRELPRSKFETVIQEARREVSEPPDVLARYEKKALELLSRSDTGWVDDAPAGSVGSWLETKPIVRVWPKDILENPAWSRIESPIPGIPDLPIDGAWVNLSLRETVGGGSKTLEHLESDAYHELAFDRESTGYSLEEVFLNAHGLTVIMGLPGAGKSTVIKWIARYVVTEEDCPFGIPIVVSLRQYAREKAADRDLSLIDYFLSARGVSDPSQRARWRSLMAGLLDPADRSANTAETFLWLFDGWDEVPLEMRDRILPEINFMSRYPGIITTRYSGDPLRLPARRFFELRGLKFGAALELAHRWLAHTGRGEYYGGIETLLEENADLRRMSRNPFLLTLLCALYSEPRQRGVPLPRRRGDVLHRTLKLVYAQHNADPKQLVKFGSEDKRNISRFAFWLLTEAPNSPRFVFDAQDYEQCTSARGRFESLLAPSRLIAAPSASRDDYQFLHASFQEHQAAQHLANHPKLIPEGTELLANPAWTEIVRLLAEMVRPGTNAWNTLWRRTRSASSSLDKFGLMASRLALWVAAAGERDGGTALLGKDLRDILWRVLARHAGQVPRPLIEAFVELDATDFARRILDHRIRTGHNSMATSWLESVSIFDLETLFTDEEKYRRVLALPEVSSFVPELPEWARSKEPAADSPESRVESEFHKAVRSRDLEAATKGFWAALESGFFELASEFIQQFDRFPPEATERTLFEIVTYPTVDEITQGYAVRELVRAGGKRAHRQLTLILASLSVNDRLALGILGNLGEARLSHREAQVVADFLRSSKEPETTMAAAELMASARLPDAAADLLSAFVVERNRETRATILRVLGEMADESNIENLWALKDTGSLKNPDEWGLWLRAFLLTLGQRAARVQSAGRVVGSGEVQEQIREWEHALRELLLERRGATREQLLIAAFEFPHVLGPRAMGEMIRCIEDPHRSDEARRLAVRGIAQIDSGRAIAYLKKMITERSGDYSEDVLQVASDTLGELSPAVVARMRGKQAEDTMARLAFRRDILFFNRKVLNVGQNTCESGPSVRAPAIVDWPIHADIGAFLALPEEFDSFRDFLQRRGGVKWEALDDGKRAFTWYRGTIQAANMPDAISLVAGCATEMGPARAANFASAFLASCIAKSIVVIGIAGALDSELRLGDVLIPNEVYAYLENSAAEDGEDTWRLHLSGNHFKADAHLLNQSRQLPRKAPELQRGWEARAKRRLIAALGQDKAAKALKKDIARTKPQVFAADHHLATGPTVGKSNAFAEWLRRENRKAMAMEMETASVFDAVETEIVPPRKLAIRGISDFADERKGKMEKSFRGKFRELSLLNACDYFVTLVKGRVFG